MQDVVHWYLGGAVCSLVLSLTQVFGEMIQFEVSRFWFCLVVERGGVGRCAENKVQKHAHTHMMACKYLYIRRFV